MASLNFTHPPLHCKQSDGHPNWQKLVVGQVDYNVGVGKDSKEDEDGRRANLWDYQAKTAGLQSGSTRNESGGHCCESHLNDGEVEHPDYYMINIRVYLS